MSPFAVVGAQAQGQTPKFDKLSFIKYMKNIGRAYRKQATELVSICRTFVQAQEHSLDSYAKLRNALQLVDDAMQAATEAGKKSTKGADEKFARAIDGLSDYEKKCHSKETVAKKMAEAKAKDRSSLASLDALKEKMRMKPTDDGWAEQQTTTVEFLLHKSLPDECPTIVQQVLGRSSKLSEVLWNFSRCKGEKRLTLKQNPQFYKYLPRSREEYGKDFRSDPVEHFLDARRIYVLTDRPGRVCLESGQSTRVFGNVWVPNKAIIFKDVCGKLEGEDIVGASIQGAPNLWCFEGPPLPSVVSPNRSSVPPTTTASSTNPAAWKPLEGWQGLKEPLRNMSNSQNIRIRTGNREPKPTQSPQVLPSTSRQIPSDPSNQMEQAHPSETLPSAELAGSRLTVRLGTPPNGGTAQPVSPSQRSPTEPPPMDRATPAPAPSRTPPPPTESRLAVRLGAPPTGGTAQSVSPSQRSPTEPPPMDQATLAPVPSRTPPPPTGSRLAVRLGTPPNGGTAQSVSPSQRSPTESPPMDRATSAPAPSRTPPPPTGSRLAVRLGTPPTGGTAQSVSPCQRSPTEPPPMDQATPAPAPSRTPPPPTGSRLAVRLGTPPNGGTAQSVSPSQRSPTEPPPMDQATPAPAPSRTPPPPTESRLAVRLGAPPNGGTAQSVSPSQRSPTESPPMDRVTLTSAPSGAPPPPPGNIAQTQESEAHAVTHEVPKPSLNVKASTPPLGAVVTLQTRITGPISFHVKGGNTASGGTEPGQVDIPAPKLQGATTTNVVPKPNAAIPPPPKPKAQAAPIVPVGQRRSWQFWFQGYISK